MPTDRITAYYEKKKAAKPLKECKTCGLFKPLSEYPEDGNKYRPNCKICHGNKYVTCGGCHRKRPEAEMKIYSLIVFSATNPKPTDKYYCNQTCKDIDDGVVRWDNGFIREWLY